MTSRRTSVSTLQAVSTLHTTASLWRELWEVIGCCDGYCGVGMTRALQIKACTKVAVLCKHCRDIRPHFHLAASRLRVSNDDHAVFCTTERHVNAVRGSQKTTLVLGIASNKTKQYDLSFFSLEVVDGSKS